MTGKLHPRDFMSDPSTDANSSLVNNLILNNPSGRNIKFSATQQVQTASQNSDLNRSQLKAKKQSSYSRSSVNGHMPTQTSPTAANTLSAKPASSSMTGPPISGDKDQISIKHVTPELAA